MLQCEHCGLQHEDDLLVCPETGKLFRPERLFPAGTVLEGKYRIEGALGAGGMGAVFRATHTLLNKPVAVKLTLPEFARDELMTARMVREARAASSTGHRNIATVTDMGWTDEGGLFIVMEYLNGITLQELIRREGALPVDRAVSIVTQVLSGLAAVHAKGVVHRDLKPENVMLVQDEEGADLAKILDFGISKILGDDKALELTQTGLVIGSPRFMSPEQARGSSTLDHRVDVYATGGILYTLLAGQPPLSADNYHAMLAVILSGKIAPLSSVAPSVPKALDRVVGRAMALDHADRYADAVAFREALRPFLPTAPASVAGAPVSARSHPAPGDDGAQWSVDSLVALDELDGGDAARQDGPAVAAPSTAELSAPTQSKQRPAAAAAPAKALAGDPGALPLAGRGPAVDMPLELDLEDDWRSRHPGAPPAEPQGRAAPRPSSLQRDLHPQGLARLARHAALVLGLALVAGALWFFREPLMATFLGLPRAHEQGSGVLVLLETEPRGADVYVDGVLQLTKPIELPRSDQVFSIRVQAPGYRSERLKVRGDRTQTLRVALKRTRARSQ